MKSAAIVDRLVKELKGTVSGWLFGRVQRSRGATSDAAYPFAGDVLAYQSHRGANIRTYIRDRIVSRAEPAVVIAHSLGGVAAVELLISEPSLPVHRLITVGSQAPLLYELDLLNSLRFGERLPDSFPPWLNLFDYSDLLSYIGRGVFGERVYDQDVDNGVPFPEAHSAYWSNEQTWRHIKEFIRPD